MADRCVDESSDSDASDDCDPCDRPVAHCEDSKNSASSCQSTYDDRTDGNSCYSWDPDNYYDASDAGADDDDDNETKFEFVPCSFEVMDAALNRGVEEMEEASGVEDNVEYVPCSFEVMDAALKRGVEEMEEASGVEDNVEYVPCSFEDMDAALKRDDETVNEACAAADTKFVPCSFAVMDAALERDVETMDEACVDANNDDVKFVPCSFAVMDSASNRSVETMDHASESANVMNVTDETLEENNNDPNNNMDSIEQSGAAGASSSETATHRRGCAPTYSNQDRTPSPQPGCSKDSRPVPVDRLTSHDPSDRYIVHEKANHIMNLVKKINPSSVFQAINKNFALNLPITEIKLWDLLPDEDRHDYLETIFGAHEQPRDAAHMDHEMNDYQDAPLKKLRKILTSNNSSSNSSNSSSNVTTTKRSQNVDIFTVQSKKSSSDPDLSILSPPDLPPPLIPVGPNVPEILPSTPTKPHVNLGAIPKVRHHQHEKQNGRPKPNQFHDSHQPSIPNNSNEILSSDIAKPKSKSKSKSKKKFGTENSQFIENSEIAPTKQSNAIQSLPIPSTDQLPMTIHEIITTDMTITSSVVKAPFLKHPVKKSISPSPANNVKVKSSNSRGKRSKSNSSSSSIGPGQQNPEKNPSSTSLPIQNTNSRIISEGQFSGTFPRQHSTTLTTQTQQPRQNGREIQQTRLNERDIQQSQRNFDEIQQPRQNQQKMQLSQQNKRLIEQSQRNLDEIENPRQNQQKMQHSQQNKRLIEQSQRNLDEIQNPRHNQQKMQLSQQNKRLIEQSQRNLDEIQNPRHNQQKMQLSQQNQRLIEQSERNWREIQQPRKNERKIQSSRNNNEHEMQQRQLDSRKIISIDPYKVYNDHVQQQQQQQQQQKQRGTQQRPQYERAIHNGHEIHHQQQQQHRQQQQREIYNGREIQQQQQQAPIAAASAAAARTAAASAATARIAAAAAAAAQAPVAAAPAAAAAATAKKQANAKKKICMEMYYKLRHIFPDANADYVKSLLPSEWGPGDRDDQLAPIVEHLLACGDDLPRADVNVDVPVDVPDAAAYAEMQRDYDVDIVYENLLGIFPDADPHYLRDFATANVGDDEALKTFVETNLEKRDYPTRQRYIDRLKINEQQRQFTTGFKVENFLAIIPDPKKEYLDRDRKCKHDAVALEFLRNHYARNKVTTITDTYDGCRFNLSLAAENLENIGPELAARRPARPIHTEDIALVQEMAFVKHRTDIENYLENVKRNEDREYQTLKELNQLLECQSCYDAECIPSKCTSCDNDHIFCHSCVRTAINAKLSEGETRIHCFVGCGSEFRLSELQKILNPNVFSRLLKDRQAAEVREAGVEGLETCPFCHFASIPPEGDKIFKCLNPACTKESCRNCRKPSHVPLRCDEEAVDARRSIEEKMTEAFIRKCPNCPRSFIKDNGCNKVVCPCGVMMCYWCNKTITAYSHFRGQGNNDETLCPLYYDGTRLEAVAVRRIGEQAEMDVRNRNPNLDINTARLLPEIPGPANGLFDRNRNPDELPLHAQRILGQRM